MTHNAHCHAMSSSSMVPQITRTSDGKSDVEQWIQKPLIWQTHRFRQPSFRLMIGSSLTQREVDATPAPTDVTSAKAVPQNLRPSRGAGLVVEVLDMTSMPDKGTR